MSKKKPEFAKELYVRIECSGSDEYYVTYENPEEIDIGCRLALYKLVEVGELQVERQLVTKTEVRKL